MEYPPSVGAKGEGEMKERKRASMQRHSPPLGGHGEDQTRRGLYGPWQRAWRVGCSHVWLPLAPTLSPKGSAVYSAAPALAPHTALSAKTELPACNLPAEHGRTSTARSRPFERAARALASAARALPKTCPLQGHGRHLVSTWKAMQIG